jgi:hypothetical protein
MTLARGASIVCGLLLLTAQSVAAQSSVTGIVRDSAGRPLASAEVVIEALIQACDCRSEWTIRPHRCASRTAPYPRAHARLRAVANMVRVTAGESAQSDFVLERVPQQLDTVLVKDRARVAGIGLAAFEERRSMGFGKFLDSTYLRANEQRGLGDILREIPGTVILTPPRQICRRGLGCYNPPSTKRVAGSSRVAFIKPCFMEVFLDGALVNRGSIAGEQADWEGAFDLNMVTTTGFAAVEVYRSSAEVPMIFQSPTARAACCCCGRDDSSRASAARDESECLRRTESRCES